MIMKALEILISMSIGALAGFTLVLWWNRRKR